MSNGALKDYKFSQKNNWRWRLWKEIARRCRQPQFARVLLMPGGQCNDIYAMLSLGFKIGNIVALERDKPTAAKIRRTFGALTIGASAEEFADHYWAANVKGFDVVFFDFCGGATTRRIRCLDAASDLLLSGGGLIGANLLRGRDGHKDSVKHRGEKALRALTSSNRAGRSFVSPSTMSYKSGTVVMDSFLIECRKADDYRLRISDFMDKCKQAMDIGPSDAPTAERLSYLHSVLDEINTVKNGRTGMISKVAAARAVRTRIVS